MVWQSVRAALVAVAVAAGAAVSARAGDCCPESCAPQPTFCTRTVYRTEWRQETYTAYRCECVPEVRTRTCTVYRQVPEVRTQTRTVCVTVPVVEERTVMQTFVSCKPVTVMCRRCVDRGHWECREVPCEESRWHRWSHKLRSCFHRRSNCCEPCEPCCPPPTRIVRCWVPCPTWEEYPVTRMQRVCECRPVTCRVTVCKLVQRQEQCQVTCYRCVPEQRTEQYTVMVTRKVPCQATRCVPVCVPHVEQVPVAPACCGATVCCYEKTSCCKTHGHRGRWFTGRCHRHTDCCESSDCCH